MGTTCITFVTSVNSHAHTAHFYVAYDPNNKYRCCSPYVTLRLFLGTERRCLACEMRTEMSSNIERLFTPEYVNATGLYKEI